MQKQIINSVGKIIKCVSQIVDKFGQRLIWDSAWNQMFNQVRV